MDKNPPDPAILKARKLFDRSGKSLDELGRELGLEGETARKGAWQLLNKVSDPKISTLRLLAKALGVPVEELVVEDKREKSMPQKPRKPVTITSFYKSGKPVDKADEERRLCRKANRTINKQAESGASSGEFEVEDGVICKWREE